jgi:CheY-like chemotaxis protein
MNASIKIGPSQIERLPETPAGVYLGSAMMPTILVCDDEPELIEILTSLLKQHYPSLNVVSAADGVEALHKVGEYLPHVILTDFKMPNLNGIEFVRELRKKRMDIPVIFISSFADREHMKEFNKLGVVDFQDKPIDPEKLGYSVANALKIAQFREGIKRLGTLNIRAHELLVKPELQSADSMEDRTKKTISILEESAHLSSFILGL